MFELVEVSLDEVALFVDPCAEREAAGSGFLRRDVGPGSFLCGEAANGVAVVSTVGEQDRIGLEGVEHGESGLAVMRLSGRQDEIDWPPFGIDKRMDLGGEPAAGTSHATIVIAPLFAVAACW